MGEAVAAGGQARRRAVRRVAGVMLGFSLGAAMVASAATVIDRPADLPTRTAVRLQTSGNTIVISDSGLAALRWVPGSDNAVLGFRHTLDLESCRRLVLPSCGGREGRKPPTALEALEAAGDKFTTLVIATGYNDSSSNFGAAFDTIVLRARALGYRRILWWTLRSAVDYVSPGSVGDHREFGISNQILRDKVASGRFPDVVIADWGRYTRDRHDWFVTDGVHYRTIGAWAAADYLSRKMAFVEQRNCPMPLAPGQPTQNPCPDPDVQGPRTDLDGLYTIGRDGVLCYEIGEERRVECRVDHHVVQLTREMRFGMTGEDVEALQARLTRLGFLTDDSDGQYGPNTVAAVSSFQSSAGLVVNGVANKTTLAALGFDVSGLP